MQKTTMRVATPADARALAAFAERTFRETFAPDNAASDLDMYCQQTFGEAKQLGELSDAACTILLVETEGVPVAYAQLRWQSHSAAVEQSRCPAELQRFYVDTPWQGQGLAKALMARLMVSLAENDVDVLWLGVWEHNPRAITFYNKHGFQVAGEHKFLLGADMQRDLVMVRPIEPLQAARLGSDV